MLVVSGCGHPHAYLLIPNLPLMLLKPLKQNNLNSRATIPVEYALTRFPLVGLYH
jgi:hypothetical protein